MKTKRTTTAMGRGGNVTDGKCDGENLPALLVHIDGLAVLRKPDTCEKNVRLRKQPAEITSCRHAEHVYRVRGGPSRTCEKDAVTKSLFRARRCAAQCEDAEQCVAQRQTRSQA
jgi:hypothetical protein